ncbi:MAG: PepSY-like domain-containing protein [Bacteroidota bacterium]
MNNLFLLSLSLLLCIVACGENAEGEQAVNETAYEKAFAAKYSNAKDVDWRMDDNGYHEAHFKIDGDKYRADFDDDGNWRETERSMDYGDLPDAVKETIKEQYDKDDIEEIELVDSSSKGTFYDVEFKDDGKKWDVEINKEGKIIGVVE